MSKLKEVIEDFQDFMDTYKDFPPKDDQAYYDKGEALNSQAQDEYELDKFINSIEGRLSGFTSQQLIDEYYRRLFEPQHKALQDLIEQLDNMRSPF